MGEAVTVLLDVSRCHPPRDDEFRSTAWRPLRLTAKIVLPQQLDHLILPEQPHGEGIELTPPLESQAVDTLLKQRLFAGPGRGRRGHGNRMPVLAVVALDKVWRQALAAIWRLRRSRCWCVCRRAQTRPS